MTPLFIGYYTPGPYEREASQLSATLDRFGFEREIVPVPDLADWSWNCSQKARVVYSAMARHPGRPVVYLDADARVIRSPDLFLSTPDCDFAAHWLGGEELISACMYFAATPAAQRLVWLWMQGCQDRPGVWDQKTLQTVVEQMPELRVMRLPPEYNWICAQDGVNDISQSIYGALDPVIVQRQASRRLRVS
jgi:hypothetical protein